MVFSELRRQRSQFMASLTAGIAGPEIIREGIAQIGTAVPMWGSPLRLEAGLSDAEQDLSCSTTKVGWARGPALLGAIGFLTLPD